MTTHQWSVRGLALSTVAIALSYGSAFLPGGAPPWAAWLLAIAIAAIVVSFMALGASRPARGLGRLRLVLALTFVMIAGAFGLALALPAEAAGDPLWAGFPRRAAILLYGVGLLPLFVLPLAYARTFDEQTLSDADLERVRATVRAIREAEAARATVAGAGAPPQEHDGALTAELQHRSAAASIAASPAGDVVGGAR